MYMLTSYRPSKKAKDAEYLSLKCGHIVSIRKYLDRLSRMLRNTYGRLIAHTCLVRGCYLAYTSGCGCLDYATPGPSKRYINQPFIDGEVYIF